MLKHSKRILALVGATAAVALVWAGLTLAKGPKPPQAPQATVSYSIQFIEKLPGGTLVYPSGINNHGDVVGVCYVPAGPGNLLHAFVYTADYRTVDLNDLIDAGDGMQLLTANGINDDREIAGRATWNPDYDRSAAFRLKLVKGAEGNPAAELDILPTFGLSGDDEGYDINNQGDVAGRQLDEDGTYRAFVFSDADGVVNIGKFLEGTSCAYAINDFGSVTGEFYPPGDSFHAFLYTPGGGMEDLNPKLYNTESCARDINLNGCVVGFARSAQKVQGGYPSRAFVYTNDGMIDLGTLGGRNSDASGINSRGEVVGLADDSQNNIRAFLYTDKTTDPTRFVMFKLQDLVVNLPPGFQGTIYPRKINDAGQICGFVFHGHDAAYTEAVLLTPVTK